MNTSLFLALLTAHLLSDYCLQWESFCNNKRCKGLKGYALYVHTAIVFFVTLIAVEPSTNKLVSCGWILYAWIAGIAISHFLIDMAKSAIENSLKKKNQSLSIVEFGPFIFLTEKQTSIHDKDVKSYTLKSLWLYLGDQLLHIAVLVAVSMLCGYECDWTQITITNNLNIGLVIVAFLLCGKAGNHFIMPFIQFVFSNSKQPASYSEKTTNVHAGAMIGILERWLILICILAGQYEPIGFLVAAKSIIRYKEADTSTTEYVLAGTLFSIAIAVICGVSVIMLSGMV